MTGNVLRRLREAHGIRAAALDCALGGKKGSAYNIERASSWCATEEYRDVRRGNFARYLRALRVLLPKRDLQPVVRVPSCPRGTTHWLGKEPVRYVTMHGHTRGFRWDGSDWMRSARVEDAAGKAVAV